MWDHLDIHDIARGGCRLADELATVKDADKNEQRQETRHIDAT
jgi:hypothetical protein